MSNGEVILTGIIIVVGFSFAATFGTVTVPVVMIMAAVVFGISIGLLMSSLWDRKKK